MLIFVVISMTSPPDIFTFKDDDDVVVEKQQQITQYDSIGKDINSSIEQQQQQALLSYDGHGTNEKRMTEVKDHKAQLKEEVSFVVLLFYCFIVLLFCCFIVLLFYCFIVLLFYYDILIVN